MRTLIRQPLSWNETAPLLVTVSRRIPATPDEVWAVLEDHASWPTWFTSLKSVEPGPTAAGVGGTRRVTLGPVVVDEEFLAWEPGRRFAFGLTHSSRPGLRTMNEDIVLEPNGDDATVVTYTQAIDPVGGRITAAVLRPGMRRALEAGLAGLEDRLRA